MFVFNSYLDFTLPYITFFTDVENPKISNCMNESIIMIEKYKPFGSVLPIPTAVDNGGVMSLEVTPAWPSSSAYVRFAGQALQFSYTFTDYSGNSEECKYTIMGLGKYCMDKLQCIYLV